MLDFAVDVVPSKLDTTIGNSRKSGHLHLAPEELSMLVILGVDRSLFICLAKMAN